MFEVSYEFCLGLLCLGGVRCLIAVLKFLGVYGQPYYGGRFSYWEGLCDLLLIVWDGGIGGAICGLAVHRY